MSIRVRWTDYSGTDPAMVYHTGKIVGYLTVVTTPYAVVMSGDRLELIALHLLRVIK